MVDINKVTRINRLRFILVSLLCLIAANYTDTAHGASSDGRILDHENSGHSNAINKTLIRPSASLKYAVEQLQEFQCDHAIVILNTLLLNNNRNLSSDSDKIRSAQLLALIGRAFEFDENELAAAQAYSLASLLDPKNDQDKALLAHMLEWIGRTSESEQLYADLEKKYGHPSNLIIAESFATHAIHHGDFPKAELLMKEALATFPGNMGKGYAYALLARCLLGEGFTNSAAPLYQRAAHQTNSPYMAEIYSARAALCQRQFGKAFNFYTTAGKILPAEPTWHMGIADCPVAQIADTTRNAELLAAVNSRRLSSAAFVRLACHYRQIHEEAKALACVNYLQRVKPWSERIHIEKAAILKAQGKKEAAEQELKHLLNIAPLNLGAYLDLSRLYREMGRPQDSIAILRKGGQILPYTMIIQYQLGKECGNLKLWDESYQAYQQALHLCPSTVDKLNSLAQNYIASAHAGLGAVFYQHKKLSEALAEAKLFNKHKMIIHLDGMLGMVPYRPQRLDFSQRGQSQTSDHIALADMLFECGLFDDCAKEYRAALNDDPDDLNTRSYLMFALTQTSNWMDVASEDLTFSKKLLQAAPHTFTSLCKQIYLRE